MCREALASTQIQTPRIPVISNVDAQPHSDPDTIKDILARQVGGSPQGSGSQPNLPAPPQLGAGWASGADRPVPQLTSPVLWEKTLTTLLDKGLERSYEIGPNKVIAGIMKRINKAHSMQNITA